MKLHTVLFHSIFLISFGLRAQNLERIDSLSEELDKAKNGEAIFALSSQLWTEYINSDVRTAMQYAERIAHLGKELGRDTILSDGLYKQGVSYAYLNEFDSSGLYFRQALAINEQRQDYRNVASVQRNLGQDFNMLGELDSALHYYRLAGDNYSRLDDSIGLADIYNSQAIAYLMKGYYNLAFRKAVEGERIFEQHDELALDLVQNRMVIASICGEMKDTLNAVRYLKKTLAYFEANQMPRQFVSNGIVLADLLIPNYEQHPEVFALVDSMTAKSNRLEDISLWMQTRAAEAGLAYHQGHYERAEAIQNELVDRTKEDEFAYLRSEFCLSLGRTLVTTQKYAQAIVLLQQTVALAEQFSLAILRRDALQLLARAYEGVSDFRNSLLYYKQYKNADEEIYNQERTTRFDELQTIYEIDQKEAALALQEEEIKVLNAEAAANRLSSALYGTGMLSFILISGLLFFGFRQRLKKNQLEREQREMIFKQQLDFKKKELTSQTLHLVQKNSFIQEINDKLEEIKRTPERYAVELNKLLLTLRRQAGEDKTWEVFKSYFSEVHNDFDQQLRSIAPEVTENDIRLASFLRMNLTTKEIASLLNVLPESVAKSKYRLKKKLGLPKEQDLNTYLSTL